jgi:hypothetical protein
MKKDQQSIRDGKEEPLETAQPTNNKQTYNE